MQTIAIYLCYHFQLNKQRQMSAHLVDLPQIYLRLIAYLTTMSAFAISRDGSGEVAVGGQRSRVRATAPDARCIPLCRMEQTLIVSDGMHRMEM